MTGWEKLKEDLMGSNEVIQNAIKKCGASFEKGKEEKLTKKEIAKILATELFEITNGTGQKLVEVRDYDAMKKKGPFKYSGQVDTLHAEGLLPHDLFEQFQELGLGRHSGPSYLRVKGLITDDETRDVLGKQMAYLLKDYFKEKPPSKEGYVLLVPNMTGGAWIGIKTKEQSKGVLPPEVKLWRTTPYARETRKTIDVIPQEAKIVDYIEGVLPSPDETSAIVSFEELRTTAETTKNAINIFRGFEYIDPEFIASCVFDYRHPAGTERLKRMHVSELYLVGGADFFEATRELGYISESQYKTTVDWLSDWHGFSREMMPILKERKLRGEL
ncbi:MAG: hypothetical protein NTY20_02675 [Candidatus Aenigmarchaeota archaeon]|nr:hypothetical protein [Candidatus Aenigmarchaeota archaeon]